MTQKPSTILFNSTQLTQDANFPDLFINSRIIVLLAFILKKDEKTNVIAIFEDTSVSLS